MLYVIPAGASSAVESLSVLDAHAQGSHRCVPRHLTLVHLCEFSVIVPDYAAIVSHDMQVLVFLVRIFPHLGRKLAGIS